MGHKVMHRLRRVFCGKICLNFVTTSKDLDILLAKVPCFPENKTRSNINFLSKNNTRAYFGGYHLFSLIKNKIAK